MIKYNEKQLKCIMHPMAPLMIIAGAGTGKTATIIGRICYFIEQRKINPSNILALTFTVKAAENLKEKIVDQMEKNYQTIELEFSYEDGKVIANAQKGVEVLERVYDDDGVKLKIRGSRPRINQILSWSH